MPAVAVAQAILALMPLVTTGTQHLLDFVRSVRSVAMQTAEWPTETEIAYQARLLAKAERPESQPDPPETK